MIEEVPPICEHIEVELGYEAVTDRQTLHCAGCGKSWVLEELP